MIYLLLLVAVIAVLIVAVYNSLIRLRNNADQAWSDIDTQLKKRYDLIPNLVETVKGYAAHEQQTLENVTKARTAAMGAQTLEERADAENTLTGALKTIFALSESYPDLKANQNFLDLQKTLTEVENAIQPARQRYNETVKALNTKIEVFPNNIIARPLGFKKKEFFGIKEEEREAPKVSFEEKPKTPEQPQQAEAAKPAEPTTPPAQPENPTEKPEEKP